MVSAHTQKSDCMKLWSYLHYTHDVGLKIGGTGSCKFPTDKFTRAQNCRPNMSLKLFPTCVFWHQLQHFWTKIFREEEIFSRNFPTIRKYRDIGLR